MIPNVVQTQDSVHPTNSCLFYVDPRSGVRGLIVRQSGHPDSFVGLNCAKSDGQKSLRIVEKNKANLRATTWEIWSYINVEPHAAIKVLIQAALTIPIMLDQNVCLKDLKL